jgi:hypothetical protein
MPNWHVGDKVRIVDVRGGVVFKDERGRLRARWPRGSVSYLDSCVPDEGPDGRIFPNEWDACEGCGNPTAGNRGQPFCINCTERHDRDTAWKPAPESPRVPAPSIGVHVAGVLRPNKIQHCARCGAVLSHLHSSAGPYPVGALVERGEGWQAMTLQTATPTCEAT